MVMPAVSSEPFISSMEPLVLSSMVSAIFWAAPSLFIRPSVRLSSSSLLDFNRMFIPLRASVPNIVAILLSRCSSVNPEVEDCSSSMMVERGFILPSAS